jgi:hypothetical protein
MKQAVVDWLSIADSIAAEIAKIQGFAVSIEAITWHLRRDGDDRGDALRTSLFLVKELGHSAQLVHGVICAAIGRLEAAEQNGESTE